ncbi:hypothetical protein [Nostoc sp. 106C]|uniref:hypothetical protein n=1 Tax=Nostoc sp. 106C TaxID=1932667 RepID=UPI000A3651AC|nr:hypothetical protein [Nostoc sp. 106C]OUL20262.1 hypothetical protein BV375_31050 [Nostoc sp. 106C]OUL22379.1 hypothetical protein BV378_24775 [Nostoc sp. RF31YmG]
MSYYNFNDHFWSPKKVCSQATQAKSKENIASRRIILAMLSLAFITIGTPLLLPKLVTARNENQSAVSLNKNLGNRCILVGGKRLQIHCSAQE